MSTVAEIGRSRFTGASRAYRLSRRGAALFVWLFFSALTVSVLYPLVFLSATALRTTSDYRSSPGGIPKELTLENIQKAFDKAHVGDLALHSLMVVVPAVLLLTVLACLAAYALVHFEFPLRRTTLTVVVAMMALPPVALLIPVFKLMLDAGLLNTRLGLVLVYTAISLPFSIYLLASFMRSVPGELLKAAEIDGAGPLRTLWSVVIPLIRPGILTLMTLLFLFLWNEFLFSLVILQTDENRTIMVGIAQYRGHYEENFGAVAAGLLLSMIPPLLIFAFFQRGLARGLTAGATK